MPIIGTLLHPMYMLVNGVVLGNSKLDLDLCGPNATKEILDSFDCLDNKTLLASFGLGSATIGIYVFAPCICYSLALSNIIPQAYGAGHKRLCGAYLNRMIITQLMIFIPYMIPMMFVENMFLFMGQSQSISYVAGLYCKIVTPGMIFYCIGFSYNNFASCHGV